MKNKTKNFVVTTDRETASMLEREGFQLIDSSNGRYTFLNNAVFTFSSKDKIMFTDKLCV